MMELSLQTMSLEEGAAFCGLILLAVFTAACVFTFLEIAWESVFKK
jgi:hypothetical protein